DFALPRGPLTPDPACAAPSAFCRGTRPYRPQLRRAKDDTRPMLTSGGIAGFSTIKVKKVLIIAACPERRRPGKASAAELPTAGAAASSGHGCQRPRGQQACGNEGASLPLWALPSFLGRANQSQLTKTV